MINEDHGQPPVNPTPVSSLPQQEKREAQNLGNETPLASEHSTVLGQNALRVKVAKLCGWTNLKNFSILHGDRITGLRGIGPGWIGRYRGSVPDYPSDLNACAEFEKTLNWSQGNEYAKWLDCLFRTEDDSDGEWLWGATAEQRCRAFVATMEGKSVQ